MIKKISIRALRPGMFVHDINCSWVTHPLFSTRFMTKKDEDVEKLIEMGVSTVYIDSSKGEDVQYAHTESEVHLSIDRELFKLAESRSGGENTEILSTREELSNAIQIHNEANQTIHDVMSDVRLGKHVELESIEPMVHGIVDSIFRNSGALIQLGSLHTKDQYTFAHSVNVCALLTGFARTLQLGSDIIKKISIGGMLHDIGKMRVPLAVLNKPARLTEGEFDEMRQHVRHGVEIISEVDWISPISMQVVSQHHERYDGSGYPARLKGEQISQFGQMAAIVDVYDAITSNRVYHQGMAPATEIVNLVVA